ncbi:MAG: DUF3618 domain-containing protein [Jatrophihabitans sp.]|uniref:DUF3618 domain-containing protein n=1 Tax=Jatrophihabitans sp. TaxID=1932789 RepID=UPI003F7F21CC
MSDADQPRTMGERHPIDITPDDPEQLRAQIEQTREELAQTVEAIAEKVNVKKQAGLKVDEVKTRVGEAATHAVQAAPPPVQHALDTAITRATPLARQAKPYRKEILAGVGAALFVLLVLRRRGD